MLKSFKIVLVFVVLLLCVAPAIAERNSQLCDDGWKFAKGQAENAHKLHFNDSSWRTVNLPHDWTIEDLEPLPPAKPSLAITEGKWRFVRGDDMAYKATNHDDSKWQEVQLPDAWEMYADYKDYKVYGWLRRKITIPAHGPASNVLSVGPSFNDDYGAFRRISTVEDSSFMDNAACQG